MSAVILPFRSNNPETDLLARRNAEEAKRRLRDVGEYDFHRSGPRPLTGPEVRFGRMLGQWLTPHNDGGAA